MPTVREICTDILEELNVVGAGETPSATDLEFCRKRVNRWIDSLALENLALLYMPRTVEPLVAGTLTYTVGTGGDIDIARPDRIEAAGIILDNSVDASEQVEIPIEVLTDQQWQNVRIKQLASPLPLAIYYDRNAAAVTGYALIYPYPVPDVGTTSLVLYTLQRLSSFADLNTDLTLAPGYELFIATNALRHVASAFGKGVTGDQDAAARDARLKLKRSNVRPVQVGVDDALVNRGKDGGYFDYRTGEVR